jgi:hypothetical protein
MPTNDRFGVEAGSVLGIHLLPPGRTMDADNSRRRRGWEEAEMMSDLVTGSCGLSWEGLTLSILV